MTDKLPVEQPEELAGESQPHMSDLSNGDGEAGEASAPAIGPRKSASLFATGDTDSYRSQWEKLQIGFVDAPRESVERAEALVTAVIGRLAEVFADKRSQLDRNGEKKETVSTEDLRVALQRYRSFFDRLLSF